MAILKHYRNGLFEIEIIDDNGEYCGHTLFATSRCDTEIKQYIPSLEVTGTMFAKYYYDGVDKNEVEKDVNSFLDEFYISISENEKNKLINTLYKNLLEEVKYCEKENKKHS